MKLGNATAEECAGTIQGVLVAYFESAIIPTR